MRISTCRIAVISESCQNYLGSLFTHSHNIRGQANAIRDILNISLEIIKNQSQQKLNSTIRLLTIISSIFLPLSALLRLYEMDLSFPVNPHLLALLAMISKHCKKWVFEKPYGKTKGYITGTFPSDADIEKARQCL
jgi:Mg2+ and Co2+ transporter CorA